MYILTPVPFQQAKFCNEFKHEDKTLALRSETKQKLGITFVSDNDTVTTKYLILENKTTRHRFFFFLLLLW